MSSDPTAGSGDADARSPEQKPTVLVLGDHTRDLFIYDMRPPQHKQPAPEWTPPLSQQGWQSTQGFNTRRCVGVTAAIHAMLKANGRCEVEGNAFVSDPKPPGGCVFVLNKRSNQPDDKRERSRKYLCVQTADGESFSANVIKRSNTWRVRDSFLASADTMYIEGDKYDQYDTSDAVYMCLYDVRRGSNLCQTDMRSEKRVARAASHEALLDKWASSKVTFFSPTENHRCPYARSVTFPRSAGGNEGDRVC